MKKVSFWLIGLMSVFFLHFGSYAQQGPMMKNRQGIVVQKKLVETTEVPQAVKDAQQKMFPGTTVEKWFTAEKDKANGTQIYVAQFKNKEGYMTHCRITQAGEVRGYSTQLQKDKGLPTNIKDAALKKFPGYQVAASQKVYHAKKNQTAYRVVLVQKSTRVITFLDENGNELKEGNIAPELKENIMEGPEK